MRVVFMGTPDIAATCLKKILADGFDVVGVYTQPDRPKGRGNKVIASPVKQLAVDMFNTPDALIRLDIRNSWRSTPFPGSWVPRRAMWVTMRPVS